MFDLSTIGSYGTGKLGDVEISEGATQEINSYARVTDIGESTITIDTSSAQTGIYEKFQAGTEILIHVSASPSETDYLGKYLVTKILLANGGLLMLDKNFGDIFPADKLENYYIQAVTIANFDCLTLKEGGVIQPRAYSSTDKFGGIVALKCFNDLIFSGGHIDLADAGIYTARKNYYRPLLTEETAANGEVDTAKFSGRENGRVAERFLLNSGDGAAFIVARNMFCNSNSRIGNTETHGAKFCRGAKDSVGVRPSNITNIGGSTIFIAAGTIKNFSPKMIAKYRNSNALTGAGLCGCYIASGTVLPNDEGLYSYDNISDKDFLSRATGIRNFGNGSFGTLRNPKTPLNNYAAVTTISAGGHRLVYTDKTTSGLAPIKDGALVLIQVIQNEKVARAGEFVIAKVLADDGKILTLDNAAPVVDLDEYLMQVVSIPQFDFFTLTENYSATMKFNGKTGGVLAIAANDTFNLRDGRLNVEGKGGAVAYGAEGLKYIGNAQNTARLPLGSGHGSVFILANTLQLSANSRIGATYSGANSASRFGGDNSDGTNPGGGYKGANDENATGSGGGYIGGGSSNADEDNGGFGGSGANGGTSSGLDEFDSRKVTGGYGSNGQKSGKYPGGCQGAHVFIVANTISDFYTSAISTGGAGGTGLNNSGGNGAAGYGGGGARNGSGGGSSGFAFVYVNE